ncbi:MAG: hypothetical protein GY820_20560 [Gammaproteobacteria bacterium]|nr:hypothetical protein [Gammaproteobacteria bacterium]
MGTLKDGSFLELSELEKTGELRSIERQYNNQSDGSRERKRRAKDTTRSLLQKLSVPSSEIKVNMIARKL